MTLRNIEETEKNLTGFAKYKINRRIKKVANQETIKDIEDITKEREIEHIKKENAKQLATLQSDLEQQETRARINLAKAQGRLKVLQAESKTRKIDNLQNTGKKLSYGKWFMMIVSCITSMLGFGMIESKLDAIPLFKAILNGQYTNCVLIGVMFLIVQFVISLFVGTVTDIKQFFYNPLFWFCMALISCVYAVSIYSNYGFWITVTSSKFVATFYSFVIDFTGVLTSYYAEKFTSCSSKSIQKFLNEDLEKTFQENSPYNTEKRSKNVQNKNVPKTFHTVEKRTFGTFSEQEKNIPNDEIKTVKKQSNLQRTSVSKISFEDMQNNINMLPENTIIKPRLVGMTGNGNYKNWIEQCENVERINNEWVKKTTNKNIINLIKE